MKRKVAQELNCNIVICKLILLLKYDIRHHSGAHCTGFLLFIITPNNHQCHYWLLKSIIAGYVLHVHTKVQAPSNLTSYFLMMTMKAYHTDRFKVSQAPICNDTTWSIRARLPLLHPQMTHVCETQP